MKPSINIFTNPITFNIPAGTITSTGEAADEAAAGTTEAAEVEEAVAEAEAVETTEEAAAEAEEVEMEAAETEASTPAMAPGTETDPSTNEIRSVAVAAANRLVDGTTTAVRSGHLTSPTTLPCSTKRTGMLSQAPPPPLLLRQTHHQLPYLCCQ